jgi:tartrate dehydrogenase/decarboxylase/D-malate dehydrogenase
MLDHLGEADAAAAVLDAVEAVTAAGTSLTADLGGTATTDELTDAVLAALA